MTLQTDVLGLDFRPLLKTYRAFNFLSWSHNYSLNNRKKTCDGLFIEEAGNRIDSNAMGFLFLVRGENQNSRGKTSQTWGPFLESPEGFSGPKSHS